MKLTPLDIYNKEFKKKFSVRGYDGQEVDEFLDHVAASYEKALKEVKKLREENERLRDEVGKYKNMETTLKDTMVVAQETVKERKEHAQREADVILSKAKNEAQEIMREAKERVKERMRQFRQIEEYEQFFRLRLKSLVESHLELLDDNKIEKPNELRSLEKELAMGTEEPSEEELEDWNKVKLADEEEETDKSDLDITKQFKARFHNEDEAE